MDRIGYAMFANWMHRRILAMLKLIIIALFLFILTYGFFIFGLEDKDQQEIINFINK